jgi:hypothetical protein
VRQQKKDEEWIREHQSCGNEALIKRPAQGTGELSYEDDFAIDDEDIEEAMMELDRA